MSKYFKTEKELCESFIGYVKKHHLDWTVYPETCDWDIVLAHTSGYQIGIEAKLKLNTKVITQAIDENYSLTLRSGPDFRAVLVPFDKSNKELETLCKAIGIKVIEYYPGIIDILPRFDDTTECWYGWYELLPHKRLKLPEYISSVSAGVPCPIKLTEWKISALKLVAILELRGYLTRQDFKDYKVDIRRWISWSGWLRVSDGKFTAGPNLPNFKGQHPDVYAQIFEDMKLSLK